MTRCDVVFAATGQSKRQRNYADDSLTSFNRRNVQPQRRADMIQQQQQREDINSLMTSSGHSWSSSPDTLHRPSSALRNSPTVYVLSLVSSVWSSRLIVTVLRPSHFRLLRATVSVNTNRTSCIIYVLTCIDTSGGVCCILCP